MARWGDWRLGHAKLPLANAVRALFAVSLVFLCSAPAAAGSWSVTCQVVSQSKNSDGQVDTLIEIQPEGQPKRYEGNGDKTITGRIQFKATLTWVPTAGNALDVAPPKVVVWEFGSASGHSSDGMNAGQTAVASNGLGAPAPVIQGQDGKHALSESHKAERVLATNGQSTIVLDTVTMTASAEQVNGANGPVSVAFSYQAYAENRYVSSTNVVQPFVRPQGSKGTIASYRLELNDQEVYKSPAQAGGTIDPEFEQKHLAFASTEVMDGEVIRLKISATETDGKTFTWEKLFLAYNQYEHSETADFRTIYTPGGNVVRPENIAKGPPAINRILTTLCGL